MWINKTPLELLYLLVDADNGDDDSVGGGVSCTATAAAYGPIRFSDFLCLVLVLIAFN